MRCREKISSGKPNIQWISEGELKEWITFFLFVRLKKVLDFKKKFILEEEAVSKKKEEELRAKGIKV